MKFYGNLVLHLLEYLVESLQTVSSSFFLKESHRHDKNCIWHLMWVSQVLAQLDCTVATSNSVTICKGCIFSSNIMQFCGNSYLSHSSGK